MVIDAMIQVVEVGASALFRHSSLLIMRSDKLDKDETHCTDDNDEDEAEATRDGAVQSSSIRSYAHRAHSRPRLRISVALSRRIKSSNQ